MWKRPSPRILTGSTEVLALPRTGRSSSKRISRVGIMSTGVLVVSSLVCAWTIRKSSKRAEESFSNVSSSATGTRGSKVSGENDHSVFRDPIDWYGLRPLPDDAFFFAPVNRVGNESKSQGQRSHRYAEITLHTDSNPCYDSALFVFLASWALCIEDEQERSPTDETRFMIVLYSTPTLPPRVADFIQQYNNAASARAAATNATTPLGNTSSNHLGRIIPIQVPEIRSYVVLQKRWRKCATKFHIWNQTDFDFLTYYDSDHVFLSRSYTPKPSTSSNRRLKDTLVTNQPSSVSYLSRRTLVYAFGERKQGLEKFNAGRMIVRPHRAVYQRLMQLYNVRAAIMSPPWDAALSGDQRFLNSVFPNHWRSLRSLRNDMREVASFESMPVRYLSPAMEGRSVRHGKIWKKATFPEKYPGDREMARGLIDLIGIKDGIRACLDTPLAYGSIRERSLVEWW
jgi:hypothetical protein